MEIWRNSCIHYSVLLLRGEGVSSVFLRLLKLNDHASKPLAALHVQSACTSGRFYGWLRPNLWLDWISAANLKAAGPVRLFPLMPLIWRMCSILPKQSPITLTSCGHHDWIWCDWRPLLLLLLVDSHNNCMSSLLLFFILQKWSSGDRRVTVMGNMMRRSGQLGDIAETMFGVRALTLLLPAAYSQSRSASVVTQGH